MTRPISIFTLSLGMLAFAGAAQADCFADYKAKRPDPLRLHYGVIALSDAECDDPAGAVSARIRADRWELLTVMGVFDEDGAKQRKADAGSYYLRY